MAGGREVAGWRFIVSDGADAQPLISIGSEVHGTDGKVGEISRVVVDAREDIITEVVVKSGMLMAKERMVPLAELTWASDHWRIPATKDVFERQYAGFEESAHTLPGPDYTGPRGFDSTGVSGFEINSYVAFGSASPVAPVAYRAGHEVGSFTDDSSENTWSQPNIAAGTDVLDASGEKVGEVYEFVADPGTGQVLRLVVRKGWLFHTDTEIASEEISEVSDKGVLLTIGRETIEARRKRAS